MNAISYTKFSGEKLHSSPMEPNSTLRQRKLKSLAAKYKAEGGLTHIAAMIEANPASLDQIVKGVLMKPKADGTRTAKSLGHATARKIEEAFNLGVGWFDSPEDIAQLAPDAWAIAESFDALPTNSPESLELRKRLYWAIMSMIGGGGSQPNSAVRRPE